MPFQNSRSCPLIVAMSSLCLAVFVLPSGLTLADQAAAIVKGEFVFEKAPFRRCHASTVVETPAGLAAAWFGGSDEGNKDVSIWFSRHEGRAWSAPVEVASGEGNGQRQPCWNPALFQVDKGPLLLYFKIGPSPSAWWGAMIQSTDGGATWSKPKRLPDGYLGPIKNKPVLLDGKQLLCGSSTEHDGWKVHMERTSDWGQTWSKVDVASAKEPALEAIQPTILKHAGGKLQILCRTKQQRIADSWSSDGGKTWSPLAATPLPNPNSGIDATNLADGRALLVYNHTTRFRTPLNVAVSGDGRRWRSAVTLETGAGEFSYPAVIVSRDGLVHIVYTWQRLRIKHVVLDPAHFELGELAKVNESAEASRAATLAKGKKTDSELLLGEWKPAAGTPNRFGDIGEVRVIVTADKLLFTKAGQGTKDAMAVNYTLDSSKTPKQIDTTHELDPGKPIVQLGIYSLVGDSLKLCLAAAGKPRPTKLESKPASADALLVLERVKLAGEGAAPGPK